MAASTFAPDPKRLTSLASDVDASLELFRSANSPIEKASALRELSQASQRLSSAATDPLDAYLDFNFKPLANASVRVAQSMGLFDHLSSSKALSVEELANLTKTEVRLTARIVRALTAFDFLVESDERGRYLPTALGLVYADKSRAAFAIWLWDVMIQASTSIGQFFESNPLATPTHHNNVPFTFAHGSKDGNIFETIKRMGKLPLFHEAMAGSSQLCAEEAVATYNFESLSTRDDEVALVDIGGSKGHTLQEIKRAYPGLKGRLILQDLQPVIDSGAVEGLDAESQVYDFFKGVEPIKGAGGYLYQRIFHDWNDEQSRLILRNLRPAMGAYSRLLICDVVIPDNKPLPRKILRDMNMLLAGGMERSESEWHELLASEGFAIEKFHGLQNKDNSIIEARLKHD